MGCGVYGDEGRSDGAPARCRGETILGMFFLCVLDGIGGDLMEISNLLWKPCTPGIGAVVDCEERRRKEILGRGVSRNVCGRIGEISDRLPPTSPQMNAGIPRRDLYCESSDVCYRRSKRATVSGFSAEARAVLRPVRLHGETRGHRVNAR